MTNGSQYFNIIAVAQGGSQITTFAQLNIVPNCSLETVMLNPSMPLKNEDLFNKYILNQKLPMLFINQSSSEKLKINIYNRFKSYYDYYCRFVNFEISEVLRVFDGKLTAVAPTVFSGYFKVDSKGNFIV